MPRTKLRVIEEVGKAVGKSPTLATKAVVLCIAQFSESNIQVEMDKVRCRRKLSMDTIRFYDAVSWLKHAGIIKEVCDDDC